MKAIYFIGIFSLLLAIPIKSYGDPPNAGALLDWRPYIAYVNANEDCNNLVGGGFLGAPRNESVPECPKGQAYYYTIGLELRDGTPDGYFYVVDSLSVETVGNWSKGDDIRVFARGGDCASQEVILYNHSKDESYACAYEWH